MSDYIESIFQGFEILIDKKLEDLEYDKTVICTITDSSDSKNGTYRVTDGSLSYLAYSDKSTYRDGEQVRVNIPQGDFSKRKFIVGKYLADNNNSSLTYSSPLDQVVNITGNLTSVLGDREFGILANGPEESRILWKQTFDPERYRDLSASGIYNTLIIKADFKTNLYNYNYITGEYGLRVELRVRPSPESTRYFKKTFELSSKEMFGNPYNFTLFSPQAKIIDVSTEGIIEAAQLLIYQKNNFLNDKGEHISPLEGMSNNIFVKNIELGIGSNILDVDDNVVKIYTTDSPSYKGYSDTDSTNRKKIGLVWYNKDENNNFIGFNDSEYDMDYNEFEYLQLANADLRLLNQKGKENVPYDKIGLTLAANMEETIPKLHTIFSMLTQDLCSEINYLLQRYPIKDSSILRVEIENVKNDITAAILGGENGLGQTFVGAREYVEKLNATYANILQYAFEQQNQIQDRIDKPVLINYYRYLFERLKGNYSVLSENGDSLKTISITNFLNWILTRVTILTPSAGEHELYNNFITRISRIIDKVYNIAYSLPIVNKSATSEYTIDEFDLNKTESGINISIQTYIDTLKTNYNAYRPYAEQDLSQYENKYNIYWYRYEKDYETPAGEYTFMPPGWRRMVVDDENNDGLLNYNVLEQMIKGNCYIEPYMNPKKEVEKFVAVICYNHEIYKSNELVFSNDDHLLDADTIDATDALRFEHVDGQHSTNSYLVYNEIFYLFDSSDEYYQREIRCRYDGLLAKDEALLNSHIYWYVPLESTMITCDRDFLLSKGFDCDHDANGNLIAGLSYSRNNYICFYKMISGKKEGTDLNFVLGKGYDDRSFWYKIKPQLEKEAANNKIICKVIMEENPYGVEATEYFNFGIRGSNGTTYTFAIESINGDKFLTSDLTKLKLQISVKDGNNKLIPFSDIKNTNGNKDLEIQWLCYDGDECPGIDTSQYLNNILSIEKPAGKSAYGIIEAKLPFYIQGEGTESERKIELNCLYSIPHCISNNVYLSGHTYIAYNNFGTIDNISVYNKPYQLLRKDNDSIIENLKWEIRGYTINSTTNKLQSLTATQRQQYDAYIPKLDVENRLIPPPLYVADTGVISVLIATGIKDNIEYFKAPIILTQQKYPSQFLNDWDGNFMLDDKNGIIMSSMLGAGRKNEDNTFDGVLMGEIELNTGVPIMKDNLGEGRHSGLGLYGFHEGQQAFGFNIDGSAFIGKSGGGRIMFDGNKGFIASANWFTGKYDEIAKTYDKGGKITSSGIQYYTDSEDGIPYASTDGLCIDLQNGYLDAYNFKLTSDNIYLNSNPATGEHVTDYFLKIGDETKGDYISFDSEGRLRLQVNEFYLTGNLGGINLLQQTAYLPEDASVWVWKPQTATLSIYSGSGKNNYLKLCPTENTSDGWMYQKVNIENGKTYTLSGYIRHSPGSGGPKARFNILYRNAEGLLPQLPIIGKHCKNGTMQSNGFIPNNHTQVWEYFEYTFEVQDDNITSETEILFYVTSQYAVGNGGSSYYTVNLDLWHLKLEEGIYASQWSSTPEDIAYQTNDQIDDYDSSINQTEIFNRLFDGQEGVVLKEESGKKRLYISATYISTGQLRSSNITSAHDLSIDNTIEINDVDYNDCPKVYNKSTLQELTSGMWIDLKENIIWTPNFKVRADGTVIATGGAFTGRLNSTSGKIGGWIITDTALYQDSTDGKYRGYIQSPEKVGGDDAWVFSTQQYVTNGSNGTGYYGTFIVDRKGSLQCYGLNAYTPKQSGSSNYERINFIFGNPYFKDKERHIAFVSEQLTTKDTAHREGIIATGGFVIGAGSTNALWLTGGSVRILPALYLDGWDLEGEEAWVAVNAENRITLYSKGASLRSYKENITEQFDNNLNPSRLYEIPVVQFNFKKDCFGERGMRILHPGLQVGLIAEDVEQYFPSACIYSADHKLTGWAERLLVPAMLKLIQDQKKDIDTLYLECQNLKNLINGEKGEINNDINK